MSWNDGQVLSVREFEQLLRAAGFRGAIETDAAASVVYGTDNSVYQLRPVGAVVPEDADDLAALTRVNHRLEERFALVARGGGTGTNGQSLTNGIVVDTRRRMNQIVEFDVERRTAVVQPGVVLGELNAALAPHGLMFAPHVSTASRATIGGMVSTDAAGKGSLVYGRTNQHVLSIDAVLATGEPWTFAPIADAEVAELSERDDHIGVLHRLVSEAVDRVEGHRFPELARGFTGYNLQDAALANGLDMSKLLCGSEGTLALIAEVTLCLVPVHADPHLAVLVYESFDVALSEANRLTACEPIAIECLDGRTISLAASSPAFPRLAALVGERRGLDGASLLLMEFDGPDGVERLRASASVYTGAIAVSSDPDDIAAVWKVRADAVGLLGQSVGGRRSVAFVEDCAVPPSRLAEFVVAFREILDRHELSYGMFGHADVGCLHVRPALDLYDPAHEQLLRTISDEVADLVKRFGGVLWGEHGRGFRGEFLDLDAATIRRMRLVKQAFDPRHVMNPGKLYSTFGDGAPIQRIDEVPLRVHSDRTVPLDQRDEFESAFACNGNGICHHWGAAEVMCPSYKATLDPRLSPKGRADLLRAWSTDPGNTDLAEDLADSLRSCLSCGACTGRCPVQVDIPEMKSRFFEQHASGNRRGRTALLSRFEAALPTVQRFASIARPVQRITAPLLAGALGLTDLPLVPSGSLDDRLDALAVERIGPESASTTASVVIVPDAFTAFLDPDVLAAAIAVLRAVGEEPAVSCFVPSGKFDHVHGRRKRFARAVRRQRAELKRLSSLGIPLVVIEPAVSLLGAREYLCLDGSFPHQRIVSLVDFLEPRLDAIRGVEPHLTPECSVAQLFGHCTEVSLAPERMEGYRAILEAAGYDVMLEQTTCCGMAGIFGHEAEHQEMSTSLFETGWLPRMDALTPAVRCASGYSCRSQAKRFGRELQHPIQVLAETIERNRIDGRVRE
ncbi:MAG: FAD-binding and (Fe-S)-binding domain-containing protein [Ilumatobacter sp.]